MLDEVELDSAGDGHQTLQGELEDTTWVGFLTLIQLCEEGHRNSICGDAAERLGKSGRSFFVW